MRPRIIAVGPDDGLLQKLAGVLARDSLEVYTVRLAAQALTLLQREGADLLIVADSPADMKIDELARSARRESQRARIPELVILAPGDRLESFEQLEGAPTLLNAEQSDGELQAALLRLIAWIAPTPRRLWIRMEVQIGAGKILRLCQTINISISGMLVQLNDEFPLGSQVRFQLRSPDARHEIRGEAEIVRYANPQVEGVRGMGLRFLSFGGDGRDRLREIVEQSGQEP